MADPIFEILKLRSEWEIYAQGFTNVNQNGTITSIRAFSANGHKSNRFKKNFEPAMKIALKILEKYDATLAP